MKQVIAFAPATVANVAVGFDLLGFPVEGVGDEVTLTRISTPTIEIEAITARGAVAAYETFSEIPRDPLKNTATVGLVRLREDLRLDFGFRVSLAKGIPMSSGMGGSASSAVAAIVAANHFLPTPLSRDRLLRYALMGEQIASGSAHADNASPCLFGGLTLTRSIEPLDVVSIPVPRGILCVLVHPHLRLDTRSARAVLRSEVSLKDHVRQCANLAGFLAACYRNDLPLLKRSLSDLIIEPQRAHLVPSFASAKSEAIAFGALCCSLSGSGPSIFAWADSPEVASRIEQAMVGAFQKAGMKADSWISPVRDTGAQVLFEE